MKKLISLILSLSLALSLAACTGAAPKAQQADQSAQSVTDTAAQSVAEADAQSSAGTPAEEGVPLAGGWERSASPVVTEEQKAVLEKALEGLTGAEYEPLAYLGSQVVAGTNHRFLCKVTPVVPDASGSYCVVTVYEDLEGNAELTEVLNSDDEAPEELELDGGWSIAETPEVTEEARAALEKAVAHIGEDAYTPLALLATQVVAGTNYSILCQQNSEEGGYAIVQVNEDLQGEAEILGVSEFQAPEVIE